MQGNLGGESGPDTVRGPMNEGGLFVEREGKPVRMYYAFDIIFFVL